MKKLIVRSFKTVEGCLEFVHSEGYDCADKQVIDAMMENGYFRFKKYHVLYDPQGLVKSDLPGKASWFKSLLYSVALVPALIAFSIHLKLHPDEDVI